MAKMRNCPYCGADVNNDIMGVHYIAGTGWVFDHYCKQEEPGLHVCISVYGRTEQEVIDKWNGVARGTDSSTPLRSAQNDTGGVMDGQEHPSE